MNESHRFTREEHKMAKLTRRGFIKQTSVSMATFGVLAAVPLVAIPDLPDETVSELPAEETSAAEFSGTLVAHVRDFATGEISVMSGTQEIIFRDPELVMRLMRVLP
jgi:hypothetical protein